MLNMFAVQNSDAWLAETMSFAQKKRCFVPSRTQSHPVTARELLQNERFVTAHDLRNASMKISAARGINIGRLE